jgi:hypothetical protein
MSAAEFGKRTRSRTPASVSAVVATAAPTLAVAAALSTRAFAIALCDGALALGRDDLGAWTARRRVAADVPVTRRASTTPTEPPDWTGVTSVGLEAPTGGWLAVGPGEEAADDGALCACGCGCGADPPAAALVGCGARSGVAAPASAGTSRPTIRPTTTVSPIRARIEAVGGSVLLDQNPPGRRHRSTARACNALIGLGAFASHHTPPLPPDQRCRLATKLSGPRRKAGSAAQRGGATGCGLDPPLEREHE